MFLYALQFDLGLMGTNSTRVDSEVAFQCNQKHLQKHMTSPQRGDLINSVRSMVKEYYYSRYAVLLT